MIASPARRILATSVLLLLGTSSAFAVDAKAFAERLKDVVQKQDVTLTYADASASGDDVEMKGVTLDVKDDKVDLGDLTFQGVTGSTADGWTVKKVPIKDVDHTEGDVHSTVSGIAVEGLQIAGTNNQNKSLSGVYFDRAAIGSVEVEQGGKKSFSLSGSEIVNKQGSDGAYTSNFNFGTFNADFTAGPPAEGTEVLRELGYEKVSGSGSGTAAWNPKTGELKLDPLQINVDNAGKLSFAYSITGYTPSFIQSLKQLQQQMVQNPDAQQGAGMAILGLISQLYLKSAHIGFVDQSLTGKLLDYYAKQNGQTRDQLIAQLTGTLPMFLSYLQNPDFQTAVTSAVEKFLKDPKSITVSIAPKTPVPATQIIGAAMGAPQTLPDVLDLTVTSNQ